MKVPLLDLQAQLKPIEAELTEAVIKVVQSTRYIGGPEIEGLEKEISEYSGASYGIGVSSGTDALLVCLMALEIGPGDLVLTTPYSFFATMGVILRLGARPVFADIDPVSYNIDPDKMEEILDADTDRRIKAIIPVHLYGQCADMARINALAASHGVPVIEDAAQAIGAQYPFEADGETVVKKAGAMGLAGCFSFFPSKNLGCMGDGGMVICQDHEFAKKVELLRNHGAYPKYYHEMVGGNFRLDAMQAAVLRIKLGYLDSWHKGRTENAGTYNKLFADSGLIEKAGLVTPAKMFDDPRNEYNFHIYNQYVLRVEKRDELLKWLQKNDIGCEIYYPVPLHKQQCLKGEPVSMPEAERAAAETLALPVYPELTDDMQAYVVETIKKFYM